MTTYTISTTKALTDIMKVVKGGDVVLLAPGTYTDIRLQNIHVVGGVTITSADPAHRAVLGDLLINTSSGISVSNVEMATAVGNGRQTFNVWSSTDIHFDRLDVHGPDNLGAATTVSPFGIRDSQNVSVTNSDFHDVWHGIALLDTTNVTIAGNYFHDVRTDGVRGGGNSNLLIKDNVFTDFTPAPGDHADGIQLWTTNTMTAAHDITIIDNLMLRGSGDPFQGIFIRDEKDMLPYERVTITGNLVTGGTYHGIAIDGVNTATITDNTVVGFDDQASWIRVENGQNVTFKDNVSTSYTFEDTNAGEAGNDLLLPARDHGAAVIYNWLKDNPDFIGAWGTGADVMATHNLVYTAEMATAAAAAPSYVTIAGTAGDDKLRVLAGFDSRIEGGDGNDLLTGGTTMHNDLIGGRGDDNYSVKGVGDIVTELAAGGNDTVTTMIDYALTENVETLRLGAAGLAGTGNALDNRIVGSAGDDRIYGMDGNDFLQGVDGNDRIWGGAGNDDIRGDGGIDTLFGEAGNDLITGGLGNDVIDGGVGNDIVEGGAGNDVMIGGAGSDTFRFRAGDGGPGGFDTITDFVRGQDRIDLGAIDARIGTATNDLFAFIGTNDFHHVAGELNYKLVNGTSIVSGDIDGDGIADFSIAVQGITSMLASDFVL